MNRRKHRDVHQNMVVVKDGFRISAAFPYPGSRVVTMDHVFDFGTDSTGIQIDVVRVFYLGVGR